ncbi:hypothetical protein AB0942_09460 [Streptomyces nodosus]|uniref:hypothetical protein n=1 Tax=Streptomyces nodosus TaxID=40318 RepID=UPI0034533471
MSNKVAPVGASALPAIDDVLAEALRAQGEAGVRALGLLRDARRILTGDGFERPEEVAAACVSSAADALLSLPGAPRRVGLKAAAEDLLAAMEAVPPPGAPRAARPRSTGPSADTAPDDAARPTSATAAETGLAQASAPGVLPAVDGARVNETAAVLRGELVKPGRYHQARARGIVERLMGVELGAAQETALDVWSTVYAMSSGILHGRSAGPGEAVSLYTQLLGAARELLVPLPARAARVLELAALRHPGAGEAVELAGWADPRATGYFLRSGPAAAWLEVLHQHAPHLLLADGATGMWPAAPFLQHLAAVSPDTARPWLEDHAVRLAAAGPQALTDLLLLAQDGALTAAGVRRLLPHVLVPVRDGEPVERAGWPRGLTARWAGRLPVAARNGDWVFAVEALLSDVVDSGVLAFEAMLKRPHVDPEYSPAAALQQARSDPEVEKEIEWTWAVLLPERDVVGLLREFVATVHGQGGGAFRWARAVRGTLAGLLCRSVESASTAGFDRADLDEVRLQEEQVIFQAEVLGPFLGPLLARAVLDLAAADAAAGLPLAERVRAWKRIDAVDAHLHDRLLAAHLTAHPPTADSGATGAGEWWDRAVDATVRLLAARPTPEGARLAAAVLRDRPPERAVGLEQRARAALGPAPSAHEVEQVMPDDAGQADSRSEPLASWLRVRAWSPVLPAVLLDDFAPLLAALRRLKPSGSSAPRAAARLEPRTVRRQHTAVALDEEDLLALAAESGPLAAAAALAAAEDAGADGYAAVLQRLVGADPAAWTADVPRLLTALGGPGLGAFYLTATARAARSPGAFPAGLVPAALAALALRRSLPASAAGQQPPTAVVFADRALFDLLHLVWRTGTGLAADLPAVLSHLHALAEPLTRPISPPVPADRPNALTPAAHAGDGAAGEEEPAVRALGCLLEYAASRATTDGEMPRDVLQLVADVLAARPGDEAVADVVGAQLPVLHYRATAFATAHPELYALDPHRPTPAAVWLENGHRDPLLLAALDRGQLLAALRDNPVRVSLLVVDALLAGHHDLLGDPAAAWREVAAGPGGDEAASCLFLTLALLKPERPRTGETAQPPADSPDEGVAHVWWRAALDADLPPARSPAPATSPTSPSRTRCGCPWPGAAPSTPRPRRTPTPSPRVPLPTRAIPTLCSWPRTCSPALPPNPATTLRSAGTPAPCSRPPVPCPSPSARPRRSSCALHWWKLARWIPPGHRRQPADSKASATDGVGNRCRPRGACCARWKTGCGASWTPEAAPLDSTESYSGGPGWGSGLLLPVA